MERFWNQFVSTLPRFTWIAALDILLVAILIYQAISILRGRRAAHIISGIGVVLGIYILSIVAGLDLLRSILETLAPYTAFALIVMFQSEIRRVLASFGERRWFGFGSSMQAREMTDEILLAAASLSQTQTGALIVLERDIGLRTFIESGVPVDARVTRDLLLAIFQPGGAAARRRRDRAGRTAGRRGLLPAPHDEPGAVAETRHAPPRRHRRHRGIGLHRSGSQRRDGPHFAGAPRRTRERPQRRGPRPTAWPANARYALPRARVFAGAPRRQSGGAGEMIRWLTRDLGWKFASLLVAVLMWLAFRGTRDMTTSVAAPVQYRNIPKQLEIASDPVDQVHLMLRGPSARLSRVTGSSYPIVIDLKDVRAPGERTFTISNENLNLPAGVELEKAVPGQLRLRLEIRAAREVPVRARYINIPPDYIFVRELITPQFLNIVGPESRVARVQSVETDPIDLRGVTGESEYKTHVFAGDPQVNFTATPIVIVRVALAKATDAQQAPRPK